MLVQRTVRIRFVEPVCPESGLWPLLLGNARLFHVRGTLNAAAFILQADDAVTLARMIFDERTVAEKTLSRIEEHVVRRLLESLAGTLAPVCGKVTAFVSDGAAELTTFFEVIIEEPASLRLGIGLTHEPATAAAPLIQAEQLMDVNLKLTVEIAGARVDAGYILQLRTGAIIPFGMPRAGGDRLKCGDRVIALGTSGLCGDTRAFSVTKVLGAA